MHHFNKKFSKIFSPQGPHKNVSPGSGVALNGPEYKCLQTDKCFYFEETCKQNTKQVINTENKQSTHNNVAASPISVHPHDMRQ